MASTEENKMNDSKHIETVDQAVAFFKESMTVKEPTEKNPLVSSIVIEKSKTKEFFEQAGIPAVVQSKYHDTQSLLNQALFRIGEEKYLTELEAAIKSNTPADKLKDLRVSARAMDSTQHYRVTFQPIREGNNPQTKENVTRYGAARATYAVRHSGITAEDVSRVEERTKKILGIK